MLHWSQLKGFSPTENSGDNVSDLRGSNQVFGKWILATNEGIPSNTAGIHFNLVKLSNYLREKCE